MKMSVANFQYTSYIKQFISLIPSLFLYYINYVKTSDVKIPAVSAINKFVVFLCMTENVDHILPNSIRSV